MDMEFWIQRYTVHGMECHQAGCTVNGKRFPYAGRGRTAYGALFDLLSYLN